jgi:hypothetical protein
MGLYRREKLTETAEGIFVHGIVKYKGKKQNQVSPYTSDSINHRLIYSKRQPDKRKSYNIKYSKNVKTVIASIK